MLSLFLVYLDKLRVSANAAHTQAQSPGGQLAALSHWPAEAALFATVGESHGIPTTVMDLHLLIVLLALRNSQKKVTSLYK